MNESEKIQLSMPTGWITEKLGSLAEKITKGATPTTYGYSFQKSGINFIKIQNVFNGTIDLSSITDFVSEEAHQNQKKSILKVDDVLFSIAGTIGETSIINSQHLPANTNQAFAIISGFSQFLLPKYLECQLRSFVSQKTKEKARGGAMNNVSLDDLKNLELLLPPLAEQHRIVAKIETLFSELDKGIESFKTAREQLKVYRQALLKHAFSGKLTEQWRAENPDKLEAAEALLLRIQTEREQRYQQQLIDWEKSVSIWDKNEDSDKKPKKPRPSDYSVINNEIPNIELPNGWCWCNLGDILSDLTDYHANGSYETLKENVELTDSPDFALMVRATNFEKKNFHSQQKYISKRAYEFLSKSKLFGNEILIGKIGNAGKVYFMPELHRPASLAMNLFCLRFNIVIPKYIYFHLLTEFSKSQISNFVKGVGNPTIDKISIRSLNVALPSIQEQIIILDILEERFSIIDQLDQTITTALQQAEALRQSILKKAFSGQLVPQDPNDEPAKVLLERIQAEKVALLAQTKTLTSKTKTVNKISA